jgi:hypothetical protein
MTLEKCIGCGGEFLAHKGPVHRYMDSSPACWAAFGAVVAAEYADAELIAVHRMSVDAYAVQHPGKDSRQAIQSVGLHLARLHMEVEREIPASESHTFMIKAARRKDSLPLLTPPRGFEITVASVAAVAGTAQHPTLVRRWAQSAWQSWAHAHDFIRAWAAAC